MTGGTGGRKWQYSTNCYYQSVCVETQYIATQTEICVRVSSVKTNVKLDFST